MIWCWPLSIPGGPFEIEGWSLLHRLPRQDAIDFRPEIESLVGRMAVPNDKFKDYVRYAEHCLNMAAAPTDQESHRVHREMAAEWLRLADAIRPRKSNQMQME